MDDDLIHTYKIIGLITLQIKGELNSEEDKKALEEWKSKSTENTRLFEELANKAYQNRVISTWLDGDTEDALQRVKSKLPGKRFLWWPAATIAASILLVLTGIYFMMYRIGPGDSPVSQNDIMPGKHRATLTLSSGKQIHLSNAKTGVVINALNLTYNDGSQLGSISDSKTLVAETPRGGTYEVILSDGTHVWLNAASKLTFPSNFEGEKERVVVLIGEAYFAVAHHAKQPFKVRTEGQVVEDIGTEFNINAYSDELNVKTTLIEGIAKVNGQLLKPGQQATQSNGQIELRSVDTDLAVSWRNGFFNFKNTPIQTVMRQISRWYDIEVEYETANLKEKTLTGAVSRYTSVSGILRVLQETRAVKFQVNGKKIIVTKAE